MALNKVNLVRLKSGDAPSQGSVVVYEAGSTGLYNTKTSGEFVDEISPLIKTSSIYNDQPFYDTTTVPVKDLKVKGDGGNVNVVSPTNQTLDLGSNENPKPLYVVIPVVTTGMSESIISSPSVPLNITPISIYGNKS